MLSAKNLHLFLHFAYKYILVDFATNREEIFTPKLLRYFLDNFSSAWIKMPENMQINKKYMQRWALITFKIINHLLTITSLKCS